MSAAPARPTTVTASFWFWIASVVFSAVSTIIAIAGGHYAVVDAGGDAQVANAVAPIAAVAALIIGGGLRALFAVFLLRGRRWARIVLLILAVITALAGVAAITNGGILDILTVVATLVGAVLMYLPASNIYFRRR